MKDDKTIKNEILNSKKSKTANSYELLKAKRKINSCRIRKKIKETMSL